VENTRDLQILLGHVESNGRIGTELHILGSQGNPETTRQLTLDVVLC
jgi:hypothetical protein